MSGVVTLLKTGFGAHFAGILEAFAWTERLGYLTSDLHSLGISAIRRRVENMWIGQGSLNYQVWSLGRSNLMLECMVLFMDFPYKNVAYCLGWCHISWPLTYLNLDFQWKDSSLLYYYLGPIFKKTWSCLGQNFGIVPKTPMSPIPLSW